jgi:hypothetical protein
MRGQNQEREGIKPVLAAGAIATKRTVTIVGRGSGRFAAGYSDTKLVNFRP